MSVSQRRKPDKGSGGNWLGLMLKRADGVCRLARKFAETRREFQSLNVQLMSL
jgi:hypothetical protein